MKVSMKICENINGINEKLMSMKRESNHRERENSLEEEERREVSN